MAGMRLLSIELPEQTAAKLDEVAAATGSSPDSLLIRAAEELIAELSDLTSADARRHDESDEVISSAELRKRLAIKN